jgi:ComF family protein
MGMMKRIIGKFKYSFISDLTNTLIELAISAADYPLLFKTPWVIVPVPLHSARKRWRGFNQAEVLAQGLARAWEWPCLNNLLIRSRATEPQMKLSGKNRKNNLRGAFKINAQFIVPKRILLVDDVATTCSTLNECARVLKIAGATEVWGLTLAQAIPRE